MLAHAGLHTITPEAAVTVAIDIGGRAPSHEEVPLEPMEFVLISVSVALAVSVAMLLRARQAGPPPALPRAQDGTASGAGAAGTELTSPSAGALTVTRDISAWFATNDVPSLSQDDLVIVANPDEPTTLIVFGDSVTAGSLGEIVGRVPDQLVRHALGTNALGQMGIQMGVSAGALVRLTPESATMLNQLGWTTDASGAAMGVLRGSGGQFQHVIRFSPATGLQAMLSITGLASALAMQAQLSAIQDSLADLRDDVRRVDRRLTIEASAESAATRGLLEEVYRAASTSGILTDTMWSELAPISWIVRKHEEYADLTLKLLKDELAAQGDVGSKKKWLKEHGPELTQAHDRMEEQSRVSAQMGALRLWRLMLTEDPSLPFYLEDLRASIPARAEAVRQIVREVDDVLELAGQTNRWDRLISPFDSRDVARRSQEARAKFVAARERGLLGDSARSVEINRMLEDAAQR